MTIEQKFWSKVDQREEHECWPWLGSVSGSSSPSRKSVYARFWHSTARGHLFAHRFMWEIEYGPIQDGLQIHHTCGNKTCVNPTHLQSLTPKEHTALHPERMEKMWSAFLATAGKKTHCRLGHPYNEPNTYVDGRGYKNCKICRAYLELRKGKRTLGGIARLEARVYAHGSGTEQLGDAYLGKSAPTRKWK